MLKLRWGEEGAHLLENGGIRKRLNKAAGRE